MMASSGQGISHLMAVHGSISSYRNHGSGSHLNLGSEQGDPGVTMIQKGKTKDSYIRHPPISYLPSKADWSPATHREGRGHPSVRTPNADDDTPKAVPGNDDAPVGSRMAQSWHVDGDAGLVKRRNGPRARAPPPSLSLP